MNKQCPCAISKKEELNFFNPFMIKVKKKGVKNNLGGLLVLI